MQNSTQNNSICGIKSIAMCRKNIWRDSQIVIPATWDLDDQERKGLSLSIPV